MDFEIGVARETHEVDAVQKLWQVYWTSLGLAADFQDFAAELRSLPGAYGPPNGLLLLAWHGEPGERAAGTVALRRHSAQSCEAKRLFVAPEFRGRGLGRALLMRLMDDARALGYRTMFGDSLPSMLGAQALYRSCGFREVGPYSATPTPGAIYLELALRRQKRGHKTTKRFWISPSEAGRLGH